MTSKGARRPRHARPLRRGIRALLHALAGLYAVATLAALSAWWLVGDTWWTQPLNLTTFWWTLPAVAVAPAAWFARWRVLALLLAVPAMVWIWSYGTAFVPGDGEREPDLRVLSYNTFVAVPGHDHVIDLVARYEPDVLLLQEVFGDRQVALEEALSGRYPTRITIQSPRVGGVSVFSRYPAVETRAVGDATDRSRSTEVVVLDVDGRHVQVVPVHLISPCPNCGPSILERLELEGDVRRAEMSSVLAALDPDVPAVIGGDFNSTDRSEPYRRLVAAGFRDPQREAGRGPGFTWPDDGPFGAVLRIDWVLVRGLVPVAAEVVEGGPSDHRPVMADLAFPQEP